LRAKKGGGWVRALETRQHIGRKRRNSAHAALAGNTWYIEEDSGGESGGRVVLVAGQPYRRGAEICHTYSRALSASAYMLRYGTQFTCFTSTKVEILTPATRCLRLCALAYSRASMAAP
jgi:hypothetical protein